MEKFIIKPGISLSFQGKTYNSGDSIQFDKSIEKYLEKVEEKKIVKPVEKVEKPVEKKRRKAKK